MNKRTDRLKLQIIDEFDSKIFTKVINVNNKEELAKTFVLLRKYGIELEEISDLVRKNDYPII